MNPYGFFQVSLISILKILIDVGNWDYFGGLGFTTGECQSFTITPFEKTL